MTTQLDITGCTVDIVHNLIDNKYNINIIYTTDNVSRAILYCTITEQNIHDQMVNKNLSINDYIKHVHSLIYALSNCTSHIDLVFDTTIDVGKKTWTHYIYNNYGVSFYEIKLDKNYRVIFKQILEKLMKMIINIFKLKNEIK